MQGVEQFGDFAIQIRHEDDDKARRAVRHPAAGLRMIKKAFDDNGIKIAVPTVQVAGRDEESAAAVARQGLELLQPAARRPREGRAAAPAGMDRSPTIWYRSVRGRGIAETPRGR